MTDAIKQEFPKWRDWLKNWAAVHRDFKHDDDTNKRFFYGNSSYMDLGELLRKNDGADSSPCIIYDTDIHTMSAPNDDGMLDVHTFYICVLSDDQIEGDDVTTAKDRCKELALQLLSFYRACKAVKNKNAKGDMLRTIDSTTSFLNGWEAVKMNYTEYVGIPCFDDTLYQ